jgi:hypothetical protein
VSGHRDLARDQLPRLREAVTDFVRQLRAHLPDTELRLIVGMAEGADLLVAETALALGVSVEAVLPMRLEHYEADFEADTLRSLKELLRHPQIRCVELSSGEPCTDESGPHTLAQRDAMYANLTDTLIRRSSLLLALWDGQVSQLPGGTADTVLRFLGVRSSEHSSGEPIEFVEPHEEPEPTPLVYWAPTARSGPSRPNESRRQPCFLLGAGDHTLQTQATMPSWLKLQLTELNAYNLEYRALKGGGRLRNAHSLMGALPASVALPDRAALEHIDTQYKKADELGVYYQRRSDRLFDLFAIMAFAMGSAYLIYDKLVESRALLFAYLITLLTSLAVYHVLQGRRWFGKHLTYRALAETLRARFYLRLAGVDHQVDAAEVLSLSGIDKFHGFAWIGFVLKGIEPPDAGPGSPSARDTHEILAVEQAWIENQYEYFTRKVARLERASRRVKLLRITLLVLIMLVISALSTFGEIMHHVDMGLGIPLRNSLTFVMGLLAILLAAWELHQNKMATRELLWQYRNQLSHFSRARAQLNRVTSPQRRNSVLLALGKDSLMESYLWAIHRYHREHEPPGAGG